MSRIEGYGVYGAEREQNTQRSTNTKGVNNIKKTDTKEKVSQTKLSADAKNLLEQLKEKYSDMDFIVADYNSDSEAQEYLQRGTKQYSVLIEPELLEKMAADETTKEKYLGIIDNATAQIDNIKEQLGDDADNVKSLGISVSKDGTVNFFADLEKMSEKQREHIDRQRKEKSKESKETETASKKKQDDYSEITSKKAFAKANTIDELIEKIKNIDWNNIRETKEDAQGSRFDMSI